MHVYRWLTGYSADMCVYIYYVPPQGVGSVICCVVFFIGALINLLSPSSDLFLVSTGVLRLGAPIDTKNIKWRLEKANHGGWQLLGPLLLLTYFHQHHLKPSVAFTSTTV